MIRMIVLNLVVVDDDSNDSDCDMAFDHAFDHAFDSNLCVHSHNLTRCLRAGASETERQFEQFHY